MATLPRSEVLTAITQYFEEGDLSFIETVNNITFGYKATLRKQGLNNFTSTHHGKSSN